MKTGSRMKPAAWTSDKPIEVRALEDGTLGVWTTDSDPWLAEDRAADDVRLEQVLADFRARGHARPVRLVLCYDGPHAGTGPLPLSMPASSVPLNLRSNCVIGFMLTVAEAREALKPLFGAHASRLFHTATWPVSFWEVHVLSTNTRVYESRTWRDAREAG